MQKKNYTTALKFNQSDQSKTNIFQCSVKYSNFRQVTRNFSGQGSFLGIRQGTSINIHLQHEKEASQEKMSDFFGRKLLKIAF